jgi:hypothetical protein
MRAQILDLVASVIRVSPHWLRKGSISRQQMVALLGLKYEFEISSQ